MIARLSARIAFAGFIAFAPATFAAAADPTAETAGSPVARGNNLSVGGMQFKVPTDWKPTQPDNSLRFAQFVVTPGAKDPVELVVFYFAPGRGGTQEENIARWASQFTDDNGGAVKPSMRRTVVNNMLVTRMELAGNYSRGVGMGVTGSNLKKDQALWAAIVATPFQGNLTFHLFGPQAEVKKQAKRFESMLKTMKFTGH